MKYYGLVMTKIQLMRLDRLFLLKPDSVNEPDIYVGTKLNLMQFENGI